MIFLNTDKIPLKRLTWKMAAHESILTASTLSFVTKYKDELGYSELRKSILQKIVIFRSIAVVSKVWSLHQKHQHHLGTQ